jgi:acyl transferase domain-containing protein/thioesterase domain-containing protein
MTDTVLPAIEPGCIAIVGMAGRFPAARTPGELWNLLAAGREATQWLTDDELRAAGVPEADLADPNYVRAGLVLPDMESFDADFFGFSKRDAAILDPQHRHFLECAWEALEDAGHPPEKFDGAIGVFGGCGMQAYLPYNLLTNPELRKSVGLFLLRHTGNDKDFLTTRVSYLLDLKGPSVGIQTACSTSLVAVHVAAQSLLSGECDMALAGAATIDLPHRQGYHYAEGEILSPDGHCRAFDENASGTLFGSGAALVVLRRLEDAVRDRDNIYAVIRGSAVNNDGSQKAGYLAPSVDGQARAAVEALGIANVEPGSVNYIEAHGTGTPVGDPIEVAALTQAYGDGGRGFCGIGSLKTNIGHLDTAAGVASLIKVSLALRNELIPATLNFTRPNSRFDLDKTPFRVVNEARPWKRAGAPRRAAVNSLGVGGTNAHVIVEEPPLLPAQVPAQPWQVLTLSARTPGSLERLKAKWSDFLAQPPAGFALPDAAFTTQEGRRGFAHRCAIVAKDVAGLQAALDARQPLRSATGKAGAQPPQVVMMFPGGGASYPGAGRDLLDQPAFRAAVDECFRLMPADAPGDLRTLMFDRAPGDAQAAKTLEQPRYNIPALFVLEYAVAKLWESWGVKPAAVIGHSAGEYAAATIAGVMGLADALSVVVLRGCLFEEVPAGGMLAVDLPEGELRAVIEGLDLDIAVLNAPDLTIASGTVAAIAALEQKLKAQGRESGRRLHINVAAHSRLLDGILERFRQGVSRIRLSAPTIPFVSNLTGDWADAALLSDPEYWVRHLRQPVRYADGLKRLFEMGADTVLLEAGPGQGMGALARQNLQGQSRTVLASTCKPSEATGDLPLMLTSVGALWARGVTPAWDVVRGGGKPRRVSLPTYAFDHQRHWIEPGKVTHEQAPQQEAVPAQALRRLPRMEDWFGVPQWSPSPLPQGEPAAAGEQWLVFGSDSTLAAAVLRRIADDGGKATLVRHGAAFSLAADGGYTIDPADDTQFERLLSALEQAGRLPDRIVHLWSLDTPANGQGGGALQGQALAFDSLVHLAKALQVMDVRQPVRMAVVTAGGQAVHGAQVQHPVRSLALGPVRVIPREVPNVGTVLVDLDPAEAQGAALARAIVAECRTTTSADLVGWRGGARWIAQLVKPSTTAPAKALVREGGVYLLTGGLGGVALELAAFLAQRYKAKLALVSRRAMPARTEWNAMAAGTGEQAALLRRLLALESEGAEVATHAADVADPVAMAKVIAAVRQRWGAVHGVFHAAGTLQDGPIAAKTGEAIRQVLAPKAAGAQVLHELLPPGELDVFALFSSTSVFLGPPGQVDYVAANAFLDAIAASRPDGLAIHWGIWADTGMAARAYGRVAPPAAPPSDTHPLLGTQVDDDTGTAFEATYSANDLWVLREHRVAERAVLPGTAYIEIARAAMAQLHPGAGVEIRSLSFEEAMVFEPGASRQVRIDLRRGGEGYEFLVRSRSDSSEAWQQHARATVGRLRGTLAPHAQRPTGAWREGQLPQAGVDFGPRWHNISRMQLSGKHGVAEMALPERFATDLQPYALHPAVTDIACTFGLNLLDPALRKDSLFVPLSVDRIRIVAPLPLRSISRVELRSPPQDRFAAFDVSLHTPEGAPIATFEGFSLRGINPNAMSRHAHANARREPSLAEAMLACGLRAEEAPALFERVLAGGARDVVVSSLSLSAIRRAMSDAAPKPLPVAATRAPAANAATLNPVEAVIAEVWRELLGVDEVARDDDFFALGGHSLAAVRLFARIRKQWNVDLPLATLFQGSTLAGLAAIVAQAGNLDTTMAGQQAPAAAPASNVIQLPRGWSPLVPICKGSPDRRPLFCVHGAGGNVLNFKVISDRLGPQQPFYGLQAQGVDGRLPPLSTIEDMATQYVEAIRAVDPTGPYRLAGYSAGGVIAYEMAQQLRRAGAQVDTILMIDTLSPTAATTKVPLFEKLWLKRHWTLDFALDWPERRRRGREMERSYQLALEKLARGEPLPPELVDFHLFRNFTDAQAQYKPEPYEGELVLFKAELAETLYLYSGAALGWDKHATGPIRITRIGGSHFTMMAEPGVSEVIEGFRRELARLDGEADPAPIDAKRPAVQTIPKRNLTPAA